MSLDGRHALYVCGRENVLATVEKYPEKFDL